ncbi:T9SS type A sorting domain-containing protein [Hymenobacter sp. 5317J-9]|uniref:T9SS type A sorting domain-containing protein n=1 Tax=Hymenobacter sp. 5317J-9 TaxID=2932250 RepID=UPI001FD6D98D|nr:T9SS type A sorting domain-containing protein [Hymenobacter sp. 5317J-9]UOQ99428.1 T9SS type A sorting domain-containing protein [Hymenobacter sp. 5317J-9]
MKKKLRLQTAAFLLLCALAAPARAQLTIAGGTLTVSPSTELTVTGNVGISAAGTLDNQGTVRLTGDLGNAGAIGTGTGLWQLNGTALQTISSSGTGSLGTLEVANPVGATLGTALSAGALNLSGGSLQLAGFDFAVVGAITNASGTRFVVTNGAGQLRRPVGTTAVPFPVGPAGGSYRPVALTRSSGTGNYASGVGAGALSAGTSGAPLTTDVVALRWNVAPPDAVPFTMRVEWLAADELPSFQRSQSALGRWNGSAYIVAEAYSPANTPSPYSRTVAGLTLPGPYIVGDQQSPLPVELTRFEVRRPAGQPRAELTWATASEKNNLGFEVQRQDEGQTAFRRVGFVSGQGTATTPHEYAFTDPNDFQGLSYYRLKQVDQDGTATYTAVRSITGLPAGTPFSLSVYPNPAHAMATLEASGPVPAGLQLRLYSADGRLVWAAAWDKPQATAPLPVAGLATGVYWLRYESPAGTSGTIRLQVEP